MIQATSCQSILEHLTTAVLWFDEQLCLRNLNPAAESLLGVSIKQAFGLKMDALIPEPHTYNKALRWVITKRCPLMEHNLRLHLFGARTVTVNCSMTPVTDGQYQNHVLVELTQVDQHIRIAREENLLLQQQAVRNVIRGLAHEIKNPLGGLRGAAQLLERELPDERLREYTDIIIGEADRLQALLNRILGPNTANVQKSLINIHQVLMRVRQLILSEVGSGLAINCDFDPSIPELLANADQLIQAILNVMRNAAQAMDNKGMITARTRICRQMTLRSQLHKLVIRIDIIDNGPGIPAQMIDQIFYPLVTSRPNGTGLGLSIAQSLLEQHRGLIECESQPGETVFTLWLPVEQ